jgi:hypothetical protein
MPFRELDRTRQQRCGLARAAARFRSGRKDSEDEVAGEDLGAEARGQPGLASGLTHPSEGRQLRAQRLPMCIQELTGSVPRRRGLRPNGDCRRRGWAWAKTGPAILRIQPDRRSARFQRLLQARPKPRRPPLPEQPAEHISPAFPSDHPSGEAGPEFSYSTPR